MSDRPRIAAIVTEYFDGSHADVIVTKYLKGFPTDDGFQVPRVDLVSMYIDQPTERDIGHAMARDYDVPVFPSILTALTLGGEELAVDGVLLIGEHGEYAWNEKEQQLFPRKYFLEQICGVMATSERSVPVFNDKHLSWKWEWAKEMVDISRELDFPFMAGSSLPVTWRMPAVDLPRGQNVNELVGLA